ncbi:MAG: hypothetical protein RLZZ298_1656 [Pseudomonadota bacterium]|jgi:hypothetical protein
MNEERYGNRIRQALNHGIKDISPASARRLEAARHQALAHQKQTVPELVMAGNARGSFRFGLDMPYAKQILAIMALLLGMWISFYLDSVQYITQLEEVDSALLSDDLPPEAFMDNDLFEWLQDDSSPDSQ